MEETKKLSCIDCNVKKCNAKQNIENNKPYPGFCVSHNMDLKDRQRALDTYLGDENWVPRRSELQAVWDS